MDKKNGVQNFALGLSENVTVVDAIEIGRLVLDSRVVGREFINHVEVLVQLMLLVQG